MGEARFYLIAEFESEKKLNKVFGEIKTFIKQGQKSEDFWQKYRKSNPQQFWSKFKGKFPLIFEYLGEKANKDNNNSLARELDFGMFNAKPTKERNILKFNDEVWHLASWDRFADFLKNKYQAKRVNWFSDEWSSEFAPL